MRAHATVVSHHRHIAEDRPETAASNHSTGEDWFQYPARPKREPRKPLKSSRKHASSASLSTQSQISAQIHDKGNDFGQVAIRGRNYSISSVGSSRFKDLLDAQEEIRPTDFRSRLQATGARDYGEDVADRNIPRDGNSDVHVLSLPPINKRSKPLDSTSYLSHLKQAYIKGQTFGSVLRETASMNQAGEVKSISKHKKQRLSLNTYVPSGMKSITPSPLTPRSVNTSPGLPGITEFRDFALPEGTPVSVSQQYSSSPTTSNFSVPRSSKGPQRTVLEWREFLSRYGYDDDINDKLNGAQAIENTSESALSSPHGTTSLNVSNASLPRYPRRESHQSFMSSLASSVTSRAPSIEITPLTWPKPRLEDTSIDSEGIPDYYEGAEGKTQSRSRYRKKGPWECTLLTLPVSHRPSITAIGIEDQHGYHRSKSLGLLSCPLEADEKATERPGSTCNGSASELSKSDSAGSSNLYTASSGRPYSRHTASTSLDSTNHAFPSRKSEESSASTSNGQRGTTCDWSQATRSSGFNIDDYVSSDDDSFTTARKDSRLTAEGEEDLLFKPGYGITGAALPGLEELEEHAAYPVLPYRLSRRSSVSSDSSAAIPAGPLDNRFSVAQNIPTPLRQVKSDPEMDLYGGTFGRGSMRDYFRDPEMSASVGEERGMPSPADLDDYFWPMSRTTTAGSENGVYDEVLASNRGKMRLSALGHPYDRKPGLDASPAKSAAEKIREEKGKFDIATAIRLRKEEKARRRSEGLRNSREKRLSRMSGEVEAGEIASLKERLDDGDED